MLVQTTYTLALHCPYCGKIEMHNLSLFMLNNSNPLELSCSCGHVQGRILSIHRQQIVLELPCFICQTNHIIFLDSRKIKQTRMEKIYCLDENLELGFIGDHEVVAEAVADQQHETESLLDDIKSMDYGDDDIQNSVVMLEVLNKIHDIAENGGLSCRCGSKHIEVEILPDAIQLRCMNCQGWMTLPALKEQDSAQLKTMHFLEITPPKRFYRKH